MSISPAAPGKDHLFLVDKAGMRHIDCSDEPLDYFDKFSADVQTAPRRR